MNTQSRPSKWAYTLASATLFCTLNVSAATFSEADANADGQLSLEEAQKANLSDLASNFKKLDSDKDGFLSKAELKANR